MKRSLSIAFAAFLVLVLTATVLAVLLTPPNQDTLAGKVQVLPNGQVRISGGLSGDQWKELQSRMNPPKNYTYYAPVVSAYPTMAWKGTVKDIVRGGASPDGYDSVQSLGRGLQTLWERWFGQAPDWDRLAHDVANWFFGLFTLNAKAVGCTGTGNCYWVGGTGNFNDGSHWATASGGGVTGGVPAATDAVTFDSNSGAGTATQNNATFTSGAVAMPNSSVTVNGSSNTWNVGGNWDTSSGTFAAGTSIVSFNATGTITLSTTNAGRVFWNVVIAVTGTTATIASSRILVYQNTATLQSGTVSGGTLYNSCSGGSCPVAPLVVAGAPTISSNLTFDRNSAPNITVPSLTTSGNLAFTGGSSYNATLAGAVSVALLASNSYGASTITTLNTAGFNTIVGAGGIVAGTQGAIAFGSSTVTDSGVFATQDAVSWFDLGSAHLTVSGPYTNLSTSASYSAGTSVFTFSGAVFFTGLRLAGANIANPEFYDIVFDSPVASGTFYTMLQSPGAGLVTARNLTIQNSAPGATVAATLATTTTSSLPMTIGGTLTMNTWGSLEVGASTISSLALYLVASTASVTGTTFDWSLTRNDGGDAIHWTAGTMQVQMTINSVRITGNANIYIPVHADSHLWLSQVYMSYPGKTVTLEDGASCPAFIGDYACTIVVSRIFLMGGTLTENTINGEFPSIFVLPNASIYPPSMGSITPGTIISGGHIAINYQPQSDIPGASVWTIPAGNYGTAYIGAGGSMFILGDSQEFDFGGDISANVFNINLTIDGTSYIVDQKGHALSAQRYQGPVPTPNLTYGLTYRTSGGPFTLTQQFYSSGSGYRGVAGYYWGSSAVSIGGFVLIGNNTGDVNDFFDFGTSTFTVGGAWTNNSTSPSWSAGSGTAIFTGAGAINGAIGIPFPEFNIVNFANGSVYTATSMTFTSMATGVTASFTMNAIVVSGMSMGASAGYILLDQWLAFDRGTSIKWHFAPSLAAAMVTIVVSSTSAGGYTLYRDGISVQQAVMTPGTASFALAGGWSPHTMEVRPQSSAPAPVLPAPSGFSFACDQGAIDWLNPIAANGAVTVTFVDGSGLAATQYLWNFDDGTPAVVTTGNTVTHTFKAGRVYTVQVDVVYASGAATYIFGVDARGANCSLQVFVRTMVIPLYVVGAAFAVAGAVALLAQRRSKNPRGRLFKALVALAVAAFIVPLLIYVYAYLAGIPIGG